MRRWSQALKRRTRLGLEIADADTADVFETTVGAQTPRESHPALRPASNGSAVLDYATNRDVIDEILYYLPFRDMLQWRATCRELHAKLDLAHLSMRIRPVGNPADWCLIEVCTGGNILLGGWSCRYRPHGSMLYTDRRPKIRSVRSSALLRQVDILGCCPHGSPIPTQFVQELEQGRHDNWRELERTRQPATRGNVLRVNLFPDTAGNYTEDRTEVAPGTMHFSVLCENWRASQNSAPFKRGVDAKQAIVFVIDGREPGTTLLQSRIKARDVTVVYDFSGWRPPPRDMTRWSLETEGGCTRMANLVRHAARVLSGGGHVHFLGLHIVQGTWLDPEYPGDAEVPAPNHPDWHPLAVHVCSAVLARLTSRGTGSFDEFVARIHVVPQRVSLEEWGDFVRAPSANQEYPRSPVL